jgi:primosomal protein N' (replication factor Y)
MPTDLIADIALRASVGGGESPVFSYRVPARLRGLARPGQLVWAPLRSQRVQGVVMAIREGDAGRELREVADLADPEASITAAGLRLAEWVAATYRAPLYEALALLLPPGVGQEAEPIYKVTAAGVQASLGELPPRERAILYYLRVNGQQSERDLRAALRGGDSDLREAYAALAERGLVARGAELSAPKARPRVERMARLSVPAEELDAALADLARAPKQAAVVRWMAEQEAGGRRQEAGGRRQEEEDGEGPAEPFDGRWAAWPVAEIYAATGASSTLLRELERRDLLAMETREVRRDPLAGDGVPPDVPPPLTPAQRAAYEAIITSLGDAVGAHRDAPRAAHEPPLRPYLLHSGKTEVYLRTIARAMRLGKQALVLVPEIALTAQLVRRFAARFPGKLAVLHSGLGLGERYDEWRRLRRGEARLAIGSRSAVFAPLPELGLIVVDEEHELTYKHDAGPRYHARDAALRLAELTGSAIILGSATPSVESYRAARAGRYRLLEMTERVGGGLGVDGLHRSEALPLPPVRLVDMRRELQTGNRSIFSRPLQQALDEALTRKEQAILFLNRRGAASFVMCRDCGHVIGCPACSNPLTLHYDDDRDASNTQHSTLNTQHSTLVCHSCGHRASVPIACPQCLSPRIKDFGVGTQRVAEDVQKMFPQARVLRWDRDSVRGKGAHSRMLDAFLGGKADVLVGTQMIAKGLDLPMVTLVGVVAADTGLHLPDFRSGERAFQLLTQVAGRAGRRSAGAQVIIQTYNPEHYALQAAQEHDFKAFYTQEIAYRRETGYPPFGRLVRFVYASGSETACRRESEALAARILTLIEERRLEGWGLVGPAPAFFQRARGRWRWHLILRAPEPQADDAIGVGTFLDALAPLHGWTVDVDPVQVL